MDNCGQFPPDLRKVCARVVRMQTFQTGFGVDCRTRLESLVALKEVRPCLCENTCVLSIWRVLFRVASGRGNPNPPIWHLMLEGFCVCLEDDWSDLSQTVLNKPWTCPQGWQVFGRDSAEPSWCMFNLRSLIMFQKYGKTLIAQNVLWHNTKSSVEMLSFSPKGDEATIYIIMGFLQKLPSEAFPSVLNGSMELVLLKSHWLQLSY